MDSTVEMHLLNMFLPKDVSKIGFKYKLQSAGSVLNDNIEGVFLPSSYSLVIPIPSEGQRQCTVHIDIVKVWDMNRNLVEEKEWSRFGIE